MMMNAPTLIRVSFTNFLASLLFLQPIVARNISIYHTELEQPNCSTLFHYQVVNPSSNKDDFMNIDSLFKEEEKPMKDPSQSSVPTVPQERPVPTVPEEIMLQKLWRGVYATSSFLWNHKGKIVTTAGLLASALYYGYHSHWVRDPVLYSYFHNINSIASNVYALDSVYANNTLFTLDSWLRVEAGRDGAKVAQYLVDQLVPAAALALAPKALTDWGVWGVGFVSTDCMLPKLPGSPVPTVCDIVVRKPVEWATTPGSVLVQYSGAAASQLVSIGGLSINAPGVYKAATLYINLQKFVYVNHLDLNLLLARINYYKQLQNGAEIKAADSKEVALWFQNMASYDDLGQKLASCVSDQDLALLQEWYEHKPVLGWKTEALAITGSSATGTPVLPELKPEDVKQIEEMTQILHDATQSTQYKGIVGNLAHKAAENLAGFLGLGGRGLSDQSLDSVAQSSPAAKPEAQDLQFTQKLAKNTADLFRGWFKKK